MVHRLRSSARFLWERRDKRRKCCFALILRAGAAVAAAHARRADEMRKRSGSRAAGSGRAGRQSSRTQSSVVRSLFDRLQYSASQLLTPAAIQLTGGMCSCGGLHTALDLRRHPCALLQAAPSAVRAPVGLLERRRRANPREQHTGDSDIEDDRAYD